MFIRKWRVSTTVAFVNIGVDLAGWQATWQAILTHKAFPNVLPHEIAFESFTQYNPILAGWQAIQQTISTLNYIYQYILIDAFFKLLLDS